MADPKTLTKSDLQKVADDAAKTYGIPQDLFFNLIQQESQWQAFDSSGKPTTSKAGALGIAQFMPDTAKGEGFDPTDPIASLYHAAQYLSGLKDKLQPAYKVNDSDAWYLADAAYNAGIGNVVKAVGMNGPGGFQKDKFNADITRVTDSGETLQHLSAVTGNTNTGKSAAYLAEQAKTALGITPSTSTHKSYQTSGDQPPDLRDYMVTNSDGSQSPDTVAWGQAVTAYKTYQEGKALARDYQLGPYTQWVDDVTKQITADIAAGNLSLTKANDLFTAKLDAYKTATDAWNSDSFRRGAPEGAQYVPGSEPGGFENTVLGLPPTPVSPNAPVINPLQEALRLSNQADQTIGNVQVPSVPDYGAVRQQVGGGGPGSSRNADLTAVGSQFNAQTLLQQALNKTRDMAMFDTGNGSGNPNG